MLTNYFFLTMATLVFVYADQKWKNVIFSYLAIGSNDVGSVI